MSFAGLSGIRSISVLSAAGTFLAAVVYSCVCYVCIIFCAHQRLYLSGSQCVNIVNAAQSL